MSDYRSPKGYIALDVKRGGVVACNLYTFQARMDKRFANDFDSLCVLTCKSYHAIQSGCVQH